MKYRIKIITYLNDRKVYIPEVYKGFWRGGWVSIDYSGEELTFSVECDSRAKALLHIGAHLSGNKIYKSVEIENIIK